MAGLAGMVAVAATCLIIVSTRLDREARSFGDAIDGIRNAQAIEIVLLQHARVVDGLRAAPGEPPAARRQSLEHHLTDLFREAQGIASGPPERTLVDQAREEVAAYLAAPRPEAATHLETSLDALGDLVSFNLDEATTAKADAANWNRTGDAVALTVAILLVLVTAAALAWLHGGVFGPLFRLRTAIDQFGSDPSNRLPEAGPSEVRAIARAFNHMADRLDQQRQRQLTFIAAVVHDLRNPMTPLKMAADHLASGRGAGRVEHLGAMIVRQVTQLERLTTDLLDAARVEAGQLDLRRERCDVRDCVYPVIDLFKAEPEGERMSTRLPREPIWIDADLMRVQQVIGNLVSNALKYSPDGGYVEVRVSAENGQAIVEVTDQGLGIDEADLPHIFEPFRRATRSAHTVPGVGLGLSISRRIIAAHGGRIDVRSKPGVGSTFTVVLPTADTATPSEEDGHAACV